MARSEVSKDGWLIFPGPELERVPKALLVSIMWLVSLNVPLKLNVMQKQATRGVIHPNSKSHTYRMGFI